MLGKPTKTPVSAADTTAWDHLVSKMRDELGKIATSGDFYTSPDRKFLRTDAPRSAQVLGNGRIGTTQVLLAGVAFLAAIVYVDQPAAPSLRTTPVDVAAAIAFGTAVVAIAALGLVHRVVVHPHEARVVEVGQLTMDAYDDAVKEIRNAVARGQAGAAKANAALADITPGLQELIIEHQKVTVAENQQQRSLVAGDYRTALTEHRAALESEMLDIAAEVTAAARVLFSQRDDLLVAVQAPAAAHRVDLDSLTVRTKAVQDRLAKGRQQLAALALQQG